MTVDGVPLVDLGAARALPAAVPTQAGEASAAPLPALPDRLSIQPLDSVGALQILIAEVRAEFSQLLESAAASAPPVPALLSSKQPAQTTPVLSPIAAPTTPSLLTTPPTVVELFLRAVLADAATPALWTSTAAQARAVLDAAVGRAGAAVSAWRDVPERVVAVMVDARAVIIAALDDDPPNPCWLRPEWAALAPRMERFRRRRRRARRLLDPDATWQSDADEWQREAT